MASTLQIDPRHRLAAAADHSGDLGGWHSADLQRHSRDEVARRLVETDRLDRRRDCVLFWIISQIDYHTLSGTLT